MQPVWYPVSQVKICACHGVACFGQFSWPSIFADYKVYTVHSQTCPNVAQTAPVAGGYADVAHKDSEETPRKLALLDAPIQLSAVTINQEKSSPTNDGASRPGGPITVHLTASVSPLEPQNGGFERQVS